MKKTKQTKFPVARIKKIMQTDEDVGKVAMATPVLVSKALELFMASLVGAAADETRAANSKKMTPYHLKRTILNTPMFDFLHEQVAAIPDPVVASSAGGSGRVAPTGGAGKGRKKKAPTPSSSGGSSGETSDEDDDDDDERRRRPSKSGGGSQPHGRAPAKKPKVEIPSLKQGAAIPALPTALSVPALPSVFAAPPSYGAGLPPPIFTPGLPSIPGPAAGQNYGGNRAVKREGSESESGSSDEDE